MMYEYEQSLPFAYKRYKSIKKVEFTDGIKSQFESFYKHIISLQEDDFVNKKDKGRKELLISDLAGRYKAIRDTYIKPVVEKVYKYKNVAYTQEEVDFIFICSYWLIDKAGLSQDDIANIFGFSKNKFAKWECYPQRCHDAYNKLDNEGFPKPLIPNDYESVGIQTAECINKKIQAVYACSAFVGVSNDLDLFANISSTDTKKYVLTYPSGRTDTLDFKLEAAFAYSRFLFATANNLGNEINQYQAGKIKDKIIELLKMKNDKPIRYSDNMKKLLKEGTEYKKFLSTANEQRFEHMLDRYRALMNFLKVVEGDSYDAGDLEIDLYDEDIQKMLRDASKEDFGSVDNLWNYLADTTEKLCDQLLEQMSYAGLKTFDEYLFTDYKRSMLLLLNEKNNVTHKVSDIDEKVELAAIFWIIHVLGIGTTTLKERDGMLEYMDSSQLLGYVDSLNKEAKEKNNIHLAWEADHFDIAGLIEKSGGGNKNILQPVMVYIDTDACQLSKEYMSELLRDYNIILVVHDTGGIAEKYGMELLNDDLKLYVKEHGNKNGSI